jgi:hypothetical protein
MIDNYTLELRCKLSVAEANSGMPVMLRVEEHERAEAVRLIGTAPCIIATHNEAMAFLTVWMKPIFDPKRQKP